MTRCCIKPWYDHIPRMVFKPFISIETLFFTEPKVRKTRENTHRYTSPYPSVQLYPLPDVSPASWHLQTLAPTTCSSPHSMHHPSPFPSLSQVQFRRAWRVILFSDEGVQVRGAGQEARGDGPIGFGFGSGSGWEAGGGQTSGRREGRWRRKWWRKGWGW